MKLDKKQISQLNAVLKAQTELKTTGKVSLDKDAYKAAMKNVGQFLNVGEDKKPSGGVAKDVYKANPEIQEASKVHAAAAKLPKAEKAQKTTSTPAPKKEEKGGLSELKELKARMVEICLKMSKTEPMFGWAQHVDGYVSVEIGKNKITLGPDKANLPLSEAHTIPAVLLGSAIDRALGIELEEIANYSRKQEKGKNSKGPEMDMI